MLLQYGWEDIDDFIKAAASHIWLFSLSTKLAQYYTESP